MSMQQTFDKMITEQIYFYFATFISVVFINLLRLF